MDIEIRAEDRAFADEVRRWLDEHLVGEFAAHRGVGGPDDSAAWEVRLRWEKELSAGRWLGLTWPPEYGGRGATLSQAIIFEYLYARAQAPYRLGVQGQDLFGPTLLMFGTPEQKARFLPKILAAEEFWAQGFSEPDAGSDLASVRTQAHLEGDEWVLDGQKIWMTFGASADWLYVLCRTEPGSSRHHGLSLLLVPTRQPGVQVRPITNMLGDGEFCEVFFDSARTSADLVVGAPGDGWKVAMAALGVERGTLLMPQQLGFEREAEHVLELARARVGTGAGARAGLADGPAWGGARAVVGVARAAAWGRRRGRAQPPAGRCLDRGPADARHRAAHDRRAGRGPNARGSGGHRQAVRLGPAPAAARAGDRTARRGGDRDR